MERAGLAEVIFSVLFKAGQEGFRFADLGELPFVAGFIVAEIHGACLKTHVKRGVAVKRTFLHPLAVGVGVNHGGLG